MGNTKIHLRSLTLLLLGGLLVAMPLAARPLEVEVGSDALTITAGKAFHSLDVKIIGPEDIALRQKFDGTSAVVPFADGEGKLLPDGVYTFEVTGNPPPRTRGEDDEDSSGLVAETATGAFTLVGGRAANPNLREGGISKGIFHQDDVIAQGGMCVGVDCASSESFGFDTLRLKKDNLRIHLDDTSTSGSFPSNDWRIVANDSGNGGASYLAIEDTTAGRQTFRVSAGAQANSIYVGTNKGVGFGTSSPLQNSLHVTNGNSPALRLEQNGSNGLTAQTWDLAGNEANFFIRDVTGGSLPFRIEPGTANNTLYLDSTDRVGIGTNSPDSKLHVVSSTADNIKLTAPNLGILLDESDTTDSNIQLFLNNGVYRIRGINDSSAQTNPGISMAASGSTVGINCNDGSAAGIGAQLIVGDGGTCASGSFSAITAGSGVINTSSRTLKEHLKPVEATDILQKIAGVDVYTYDFITGPKDVMGLMAEDFHQVFQRGSDKMISDREVQMALWLAVQQLTAQNKELAGKVAALESQLNHAE